MYYATHRIPTENIAKMQKLVTRMNNKVAKARVVGEPMTMQVVHEELVKIGETRFGRDIMRAYSWVTVKTSQSFGLEGYRFIARYDFERDVEGNPVCHVQAVEGESIPAEYKETDGHCDHCNTRRFRKNTFLVLNEQTGEFKLFGRSCLKDIFTVSTANIVSAYEWVTEPNFSALDEMPAGYRDTAYDRNEVVLGWAVSVFNRKGFISKRVAEEQDLTPTSQTVAFLMADPADLWDETERARQREMKAEFAATDADRADVELLLGLIADADADSDYIEKLQKVAAQGQVSQPNFALLVSAVTLLKKHRVAVEKANAPEVPDVVEGRYELTAEVVSFRSEPGFGYYDPDVIKVLIRDAEGRKYWGTYPRALGTPTEGDVVTLTATVSQGRDDSKFGIFKRPSKATVAQHDERAVA